MGRKKSELYRVYNTDTGLYYNGGTGRILKNDEYDPAYPRPAHPQRPHDMWTGKHPWNRNYKELWDDFGKVFTSLRGAQQTISMMTKTSKHTRSNKTSNILYGNELSNTLKVVRCRIVNVKDNKNTSNSNDT